ncbi:MAG: hypothetical protein E7466_04175 [Ruminococcaceae bacterium]|nr:hypothetical protein [Oscillospiraceae bacterium]
MDNTMQSNMQPGVSPEGAVDGFQALRKAIGPEQVRKANQVFRDYKAGKKALEERVIQNEQWFKLRHWEYLRKQEDKDQVEPVSAWLFNSLANKHADAMDNFPSPNFLPRQKDDQEQAQMLSSIVPVILQQNEFEESYDTEAGDKFKEGTGVYGVFWDSSKLNGLGDISVEPADILSLFWEPGVTDIQKSRNFFSVMLEDNDVLIAQYPQLDGKLGSTASELSQYIREDNVDTNKNKSMVVDWYYKKRVGNRTVLHLCKYVGEEVLFASENEPDKYPDGWYEHGLYPFVFDPLFKVKGSPCGFGYIDVAKSAQEYIDRGNQGIMENVLENASPRYFYREDGAVNAKQFLDRKQKLVKVDGNMGQDSLLPIQSKPLPESVIAVVNNKIEELKEVTGNRDVSTGGTTAGATAASAIAAMQEAGSKLSRDSNKASYRAFRKVCKMITELIRQFYELPRYFRILGADGAEQFVKFSNQGIRPQHQGVVAGVDMGYRVPEFDIEITAQKQSPYSKMAQNEMALQFYGHGFFNPQLADQALACLDMMDFDRKQFVAQKIAANGGMYQQMMAMQQQMLMMAQRLDMHEGTNMAQQMAASMGGVPLPGGGNADLSQTEGLGGKAGIGEHHSTKNARQRVAESTAPT